MRSGFPTHTYPIPCFRFRNTQHYLYAYLGTASQVWKLRCVLSQSFPCSTKHFWDTTSLRKEILRIDSAALAVWPLTNYAQPTTYANGASDTSDSFPVCFPPSSMLPTLETEKKTQVPFIKYPACFYNYLFYVLILFITRLWKKFRVPRRVDHWFPFPKMGKCAKPQKPQSGIQVAQGDRKNETFVKGQESGSPLTSVETSGIVLMAS